jgi:hypothetical protein
VKQGDDDSELPMKDPSRCNVKGENMQCKQGNKVGEKGDRHGGASKCRETDVMDDGRQIGTQKFHKPCAC